jgi:hypothetical protein
MPKEFNALAWISENNVALNRDYAGQHVAISEEGVEFGDEDLEAVFDFLDKRKDGFEGITLHHVQKRSVLTTRISHELEDLTALVESFLIDDPAVIVGEENALANRITAQLVAELGGLQEPYRTGRRGFDRLREALLRQRFRNKKSK